MKGGKGKCENDEEGGRNFKVTGRIIGEIGTKSLFLKRIVFIKIGVLSETKH
jgi:hypothetical protein